MTIKNKIEINIVKGKYDENNGLMDVIEKPANAKNFEIANYQSWRAFWDLIELIASSEETQKQLPFIYEQTLNYAKKSNPNLKIEEELWLFSLSGWVEEMKDILK